jgi:hypothetical protein
MSSHRIYNRIAPCRNAVMLLIAVWYFSMNAGIAQTEYSGPLQKAAANALTSTTSTTIDFWYGNRQTFGRIGVPQRWVNILGDVYDPSGITALSYTLNGGSSVTLSVGPDTRRLADDGDFNIDIAVSALLPLPDSNVVVVTAKNGNDEFTSATAIVRYLSGTVWPRSYGVAWESMASLTDSAQVVDGLWESGGGGLRPTNVGYDRLVAIGDTTWQDFEVVVPINIHSYDPNGYGTINGRPSVGLFFGWAGHTDNQFPGWQPKTGYTPFGCGGLYEFETTYPRLSIYDKVDDISGKTLALETPYYFKMKVETKTAGILYSFKVWEVAQAEPGSYDLTWQGPLSDPQRGSIMLLAHWVDATFGPVTVQSLSGDQTAPMIYSYAENLGKTAAEISWSTDEPARTKVEYGLTSAYGSELAHANLVSSHSYTLSGLNAHSTYHYRVTAFDEQGNTAISGDRMFTTTGASTLLSDEFTIAPLDSSVWTVTDPVGDVTVSINGGNLSLALPQNVQHTVNGSGSTVPLVMQPASDTDFDVQVKLASTMGIAVQGAGIRAAQSSTDYLRFEIYTDGSSTRAFAGSVLAGSPATLYDVNIGANGVTPVYLRVKRELDTWTQFYSFDGSAWTSAGEFTRALTLQQVCLTARNGGTPVPSFTALFDYFRATLPPLPRLKSPAHGVAGLGTTVTLVWYASEGSQRYHLQVATDPTFASGSIVNDSTYSDTSRTLTGLTPYTQYHWRVAASNADGKTRFTGYRSFYTQLPLPNQVLLIAPVDFGNALADSVPCVWRRNSQPGAKYWIEYSTDSLFAWPDLDSSLTDTTTVLRGLAPDTWYYWRVRAGNPTGWGPYSVMRRFFASLTDLATDPTLPAEVTLAQNYPNPFNPTTIVEYGLPTESRVRLEVFNTLGQKVAVLVDETQSAGYHRSRFSVEGLATGIYFYRLSVNGGDHVLVRRMLAIK